MPFFSRVFRGKDAATTKKHAKNEAPQAAAEKKPKWTDAYARTEVTPEEVQELLRGCTLELKSRALDTPFLLLPFRPSSDPSAARSFIRNFFNAEQRGSPLQGEALMQELRLAEPMVLCSVVKWCWSRLPGGVVTWEAYELFKVGEQDSNFARDAFSTFIPISVDSDARTRIIFDFFDLLSAVAAHAKNNGLGGRKLSRYAGWWAFEHADIGNGFEAAYKTWAAAADATSHLFFAYLRSMSPDSVRGISGISTLPIALQSLVQATEYPPETPSLLQVSTTKVIMIVDTVSPTPFALLRRAKNFEYRDSDYHLQEFASYEDPARALTDECFRVLKAISSDDQSTKAVKTSTGVAEDASWSRFEDLGFGASLDNVDPVEEKEDRTGASPRGLRTAPQSRPTDLGRPTTPSWADFLSTGFADDSTVRSTPSLLLPPDKVLPPIATDRGQSSQSHKRTLDADTSLEPGELASITTLDIDDSFWWVWISSLSIEEPSARKAVFGRCALLETVISGAKWLVLEEQVKGAAAEPEPGAYIVEKKRFFTFGKKKQLNRTKSTSKKPTLHDPYKAKAQGSTASRTSIGTDQHARIQAAAAALQKKHQEQEEELQQPSEAVNGRRSRLDDDPYSTKTNSVMTMQTFSEATPAMKWARNYDKNAVRAAYLGSDQTGTGRPLFDTQMNGSRVMTPVSEMPSEGQTPRLQTPAASAPLPPEPSFAESRGKALPVPGKDLAAEAATVPLPLAATPEPPASAVEQPPAPAPAVEQRSAPAPAVEKSSAPEPKKSMESEPKKSIESDDGRRRLKKKNPPSNFKGMFSAGKKKSDVPFKPTGADPSAVAAARAALENKVKGHDNESSPRASPSPTNQRNQIMRKKPVEASPIPAPAPAPAPAPTRAAPQPPTFEPVEAPKQPEYAPPPAPVPAPEPVAAPVVARDLPDNGPPRTRRDEEYDKLSRIDTNEKAAAEHEFSSFDQGPLTEQPAFAPDSPVSPIAPTAPADLPRKPVSPDNGAVRQASPRSSDSFQMSAQDRWAQIRKNAAERAAAAATDEVPSRTSQADKTDDPDTSDGETIESRVARIKARVAELTGNMEAARKS